jgi:DNA segregation ATPase FtsK/SpoIIIE, S-DNA-T family
LGEDDDLLDWLSTAWSPLRLTLKVEGAGTPLFRFRWTPEEHPGLVAFARLIEIGGVEAARIDSLDSFLAAALDVSESLPLSALIERGQRDAEHTARWREAMGSASRDWVQHGMTSDGLDTFLSEWFEIVADAREALIPRGEPLPALDSFLSRDICPTASGTWVMLPTHPLRLRWLREHLKVMRAWLVDALAGELRLNPRNDSLFFDWLDNISPHRQPAIISPADRQLATAAREEDWHEEYVPVDSANALTREAVLDDSSVEELVSACRHFLHSFPHKTDGVSILLMLRGQDTRTPATFLNRLLQRDLASAVVTLHVLAPRSNHEQVARSLRDFDSGHARATSMFPPVQLMLHSWDGDLPSALDELEGRVDLALAPNLFGVDIDALTETRARSEGVSGHFDPWLDPASHVRAGGGVNVSQVMLPSTPDPVAEAWSTLTVRRHRRAVVKMDDPRSTDFVTLQIRFDANRRLFEQLHAVAHWVVTLDPFVGRDQIDALDQRPDIILVREGVGKNKTYTLVVSSGAGQRFVTHRLERRLVHDLRFSEVEAAEIAERLYEVGRDVCPGLMLRALGLGRSTEEILGLVAARYVCAGDDRPAGDGVEFWLSLDELAHWFGGPQRSRPDLLRVRLSKVEGRTRLDLLVVESKFRRNLDLSIADQQLDAGVALLEGAFGFSDTPAHDARFWHRELHRAFRQLSRPDRQASDLPAVATLGRGLDDAEIDQALLRGEFACEFIGSLVVAVAWDEESVCRDERTAGGHRLVALGRPAFRDLLIRLQEGDPPETAPCLVLKADSRRRRTKAPWRVGSSAR